MAEPFSPFGVRRDLLEPKIDPGNLFRYAARPEPIDQHPQTVVFFSRLVSSFEFDYLGALPRYNFNARWESLVSFGD